MELWGPAPVRPCTPSPNTHLEEALPLSQAAAFQAPEVDVGLPAGDEQRWVSGVKGRQQHRLVGALWAAGEILNAALPAPRGAGWALHTHAARTGGRTKQVSVMLCAHPPCNNSLPPHSRLCT